jgi:sterol desaturase/sphingolipid hydroxylase (fatty acid hydroxylase superfamily)
MLFRRPRITKLLRHLQAVDEGLRELADNKTVIPSPAEIKALAHIRFIIRTLPEKAEVYETDFWQRIKNWQDTPYTPRQRIRRAALSFIGWWLAGTVGISYSIMGWLIPLFPKPWHSLIASAAIAFIIVTCCAYRGSKQ